MQSLLDALKDGRLVELPDIDKGKSLEYLAHLIEAIPEIGVGIDLAEEVLKIERVNNTGIGMGVACPHVRVPGNGDLLCAVGWSPAGMDYGARDGEHVHLIFLYYIPDQAKNTYLKEISSLATAVKKEGGIHAIAHAEDIATVRERLLDWVAAAIEAGVPETKARMIRLEARQATIAAGAEAPPPGVEAYPVMVVSLTDDRRIVLCANRELAGTLEADPSVGPLFKNQASFDRLGFRLVYRATTHYDPLRPVYDYVAVRIR